MADLLEARRMRKEFGGLVAVDDVDFTIPEGAIVSLIGPNGAGKTTFFNMITGVYKPTGGRITFDGQDITAKPPHAVTERGIGRTFQNIRLFQDMTALENVLVGMHSRLRGGIIGSILAHARASSARRRRRDVKARELLAVLLGSRRPRRRLRAQPALRRPAAARGGARARDGAEAAAARRADRRHEPAGVGRVHRLRPASCAPSAG